jgi:hypothetical protein
MPDRPQAGELFAVHGRRDLLTVAEYHGSVTDGLTGVTRHIVRTEAGARWSLVQRPITDGGVPWIGTALPADPDAPQH